MLFANYILIYKHAVMSEKMLKFVNIGQQNPPKRTKDERSKDFNEIYKEFIEEKAKLSQADALNAEFLFAKYIVH